MIVIEVHETRGVSWCIGDANIESVVKYSIAYRHLAEEDAARRLEPNLN